MKEQASDTYSDQHNSKVSFNKEVFHSYDALQAFHSNKADSIEFRRSLREVLDDPDDQDLQDVDHIR